MDAGGRSLRVGLCVIAAIGGALAVTFGAPVAALVAGIAVIGVASAVHPGEPGAKESHACGSCGRVFDSRGELRAHRDAVHARAFAIHSP